MSISCYSTIKDIKLLSRHLMVNYLVRRQKLEVEFQVVWKKVEININSNRSWSRGREKRVFFYDKVLESFWIQDHNWMFYYNSGFQKTGNFNIVAFRVFLHVLLAHFKGTKLAQWISLKADKNILKNILRRLFKSFFSSISWFLVAKNLIFHSTKGNFNVKDLAQRPRVMQ